MEKYELIRSNRKTTSIEITKEVEKICPNYKEHVRWLKENGHRLMEEGKV